MADDQPGNVSVLLENSVVDLDEMYKKYEATRMKIANDEFLCNSYLSLDAAYQALVKPLSPAYLSGSDWYPEYADFPTPLFNLILMIALIQNACWYAVKNGCRDPSLRNMVISSLLETIELPD